MFNNRPPARHVCQPEQIGLRKQHQHNRGNLSASSSTTDQMGCVNGGEVGVIGSFFFLCQKNNQLNKERLHWSSLCLCYFLPLWTSLKYIKEQLLFISVNTVLFSCVHFSVSAFLPTFSKSSFAHRCKWCPYPGWLGWNISCFLKSDQDQEETMNEA